MTSGGKLQYSRAIAVDLTFKSRITYCLQAIETLRVRRRLPRSSRAALGFYAKSVVGEMSSGLNDTVSRLGRALDRLEAMVERCAAQGRKATLLEAEIQTLGGDRAKLADQLDKSEARCGRLEKANSDVSRRLVGAMESLRVVVETEKKRQDS